MGDRLKDKVALVTGAGSIGPGWGNGKAAAMLAACLDAYGRIDILHNNVGIPYVGGPEETAEEDWDMLFAVNAKSMYLTCQACLPQMVAQGIGTIVNISSVASLRYVGFPSAAYSAAKAAVNQLEIGLAILCRRLYFAIVFHLGIRCELVEPSDGARRLLLGRFELLALGGVLVDLAEDLGGWKSVAMVRR